MQVSRLSNVRYFLCYYRRMKEIVNENQREKGLIVICYLNSPLFSLLATEHGLDCLQKQFQQQCRVQYSFSYHIDITHSELNVKQFNSLQFFYCTEFES